MAQAAADEVIPPGTDDLPNLPKDVKDMTEDDWAKLLGGKNSQEYQVLRKKATDYATYDSSDAKIKAGNVTYHKPKSGYYACRGCGNPLYSYQAKFESGCGWPAFDKCYKDSIIVERDESHGMIRVEIMCAKCQGHLGHVFEDHKPERHCVNSSSIRYVKSDDKVKNLKEEHILQKK